MELSKKKITSVVTGLSVGVASLFGANYYNDVKPTRVIDERTISKTTSFYDEASVLNHYCADYAYRKSMSKGFFFVNDECVDTNVFLEDHDELVVYFDKRDVKVKDGSYYITDSNTKSMESNQFRIKGIFTDREIILEIPENVSIDSAFPRVEKNSIKADKVVFVKPSFEFRNN